MPRARRLHHRKCGFCDKTFTKTEHLDRHVRSHTKERPFTCHHCRKSFTRNDTLLRHLRSHSRDVEDDTVSADTLQDAGATVSDDQLQQDSLFDRLPFLATSVLASDIHYSSHDTLLGTSEVPLAQSIMTDTTTTLSHLDIPFHSLTSQESPSLPGNLDSLWFLGADFDLDALDTSISTAISEWSFPTANLNFFEPANSTLPPRDTNQASKPKETIQELWFTHLAADPSNPAPFEIAKNQDRVDNKYRANLLQRIQPQRFESFLPSAEFMNLCIRLFLEKFSQIFPVVHSPTFRPQSENALLLLSICSLGSLFAGSKTAVKQGMIIFERLNKVVLATWESYLARGEREATTLIQAALLGQTFGLLSSDPKGLIIVETFHGTVVAWARRINSFSLRNPLPDIDELEKDELENAWRAWISNEERIRIAMGLFIHDAILCRIFHHVPMFRHGRERIPMCASDQLFRARTAVDWKSLLVKQRTASSNEGEYNSQAELGCQPQSLFYAYTTLMGINASIVEARTSEVLGEDGIRSFRLSLLDWAKQHGASTMAKSDPFCLMVLWHSAFISLYSDVDQLERAVGRDGTHEAEASLTDFCKWINRTNAQKCAVHAIHLLQYAERMRMTVEPAIHVPHNLFIAGLVLCCCLKYINPPHTSHLVRRYSSLEEFRTTKTIGSELKGSEGSWVCDMVELAAIYRIIDLLNRVGHGERAHMYAAILEALVSDT